jgi:hypothetical protein
MLSSVLVLEERGHVVGAIVNSPFLEGTSDGVVVVQDVCRSKEREVLRASLVTFRVGAGSRRSFSDGVTLA